MKSLFVVGCNTKDQDRLRSLLKNDYLVETCPSVHNSIGIVSDKTFDMILYDAECPVPLSFFIDELNNLDIEIPPPIAVMTDKTSMNHIQRIVSMNVVSVIKKPFTKMTLHRGILKGIQRHQAALGKQPSEKSSGYQLKEERADILIALRKQAIISEIGQNGMTLFLPTSVAKGTNMIFSNSQLYKLIGMPFQRPPKISLEVTSCSPMNDYQFKLETSFSTPMLPEFKNSLTLFLAQHAIEEKIVSKEKTILIAEVDGFTRDFYQVALQGAGYKILIANDGLQALEILNEQTVDLLIMDLLLPKLSGMELLALLKTRKQSIPTIIATGENNPVIRRKTSTQVQDYLLKPFGGRLLSQSVDMVLNQSEPTEKVQEKNDKRISIDLETNVLVAFRDWVNLKSINERELVFLRDNPIAKGTTIILKTDAIETPETKSENAGHFFEMKVSKCVKETEGGLFSIHVSF